MALYNEEVRFKAWGVQMKAERLNKIYTYENSRSKSVHAEKYICCGTLTWNSLKECEGIFVMPNERNKLQKPK